MPVRSPFKVGETYNTVLSPLDEFAFRKWVSDNRIPFNPDVKVSDYDMRGFYKAQQQGSPLAQSGINPNDNQLHFTDYFKTPLHQTFSSESQWADENAPQWVNDSQLASPSGKIVFDEKNIGKANGGKVMPLTKSASKEAFKSNLKAEISAGKPKNQALAIAYRVQRDAKKRADGGKVVYDDSDGPEARRQRWEQENDKRMDAWVRQVGPNNAFVVPDRNTYSPDDLMSSSISGPSPRHLASGGVAGAPPFWARSEARGLERSGFIPGMAGGRSDTVPARVKNNSYIIPADIVSGIGHGNSLAGANALNQLLKMGPYGAAATPMARTMTPKMPKMKFADGGVPGMDQPAMVQPSTEVVVSDGEFSIPPEKVIEIGGGDIKRGHEVLDKLVHHVRKKTIKTLSRLPKPKKN